MGDGGGFGRWATDSDGLPCFDIELARLSGPGLVLPQGDARVPWHQVGNDRITATAHAGGWTTLYAADEGLVRLNGTDPDRAEALGGTWSLRDDSGLTLASPFIPGVELTARWGMGYAEWTAEGPGVMLRRRVWAPFGDIPAVRIDVSVEASSGATLPASTLYEHWGFAPYPILLGLLMSARVQAPTTYTSKEKLLWHAFFTASTVSRGLTERLRRFYGSRVSLDGEYAGELDAVILVPDGAGKTRARRTRPSLLPHMPGTLFVASLTGRPDIEVETQARFFDTEKGYARVRFASRIEAGRDARSFSFAVGIARRHELRAILGELKSASRRANAESWLGFADLHMQTSSTVERETRWHAYYLRGASVRDSYFECRYVPQGSAYGFVHGVQGAPRDYALTCIPLIYLDPPLAKDMLRLIMRMTMRDGSICYAHTGAGQCTSAFVHRAPTDLPLFLLWGLTEYVWATGDSGFLDESVPFWPGRAGRGRESTVRERVLLAWRNIRDAIGLGPHGMLRIGSGDWNDPLSLMVADSGAFHARGESAFNTAFAVYVLPRAARLIEPTHPADAASINAFADTLREAMEGAWRGRWFLRGWDGRGSPIGAEHLFLDTQVWCLIAGIGSEKHRGTLVDAIALCCDDPSPVGATILDRPHRVRHRILPDGWDCNGGVWAAINGLLAWAYSLHDPERAWRCLQKQSLAAHAAAYPDIWYGIWSGPDAYNAHYAEQPGETFVSPATPMREFPVMNSNAHAGPLLALIKLLGIEAEPAGITVAPRLPPGVGPWRLSTALVDIESDGMTVSVQGKPLNRSATG
jgi:hypothetical protein